ncbi:MAG: cell division protein ZapE [Pseudomonadales bacterium]|nr:cell division protein ZapE [Pseudomonadales bacterium]
MIPSERYQQDLADKVISKDANQQRIVLAFDKLYRDIQISSVETQSFTKKVFGLFGNSDDKSNRRIGIYLWGGVGRGKTYLMDLFFECLPLQQKRRTHFHRFMQSVHKELKKLQGQKNPLETIASTIASKTQVLCFDEFFVLDIGDAMILAGLLEALFEHGVILIATSNIPPDSLYENGLQRERFLPAIDLIKQNTEILELDGEVDYRLRSLSQATLYHCPIDEVAETALLKSFHELVPNRLEIVVDGSLTILDREISSRCHAEDVAWFDFYSLCDGPRSAFDYVEIAKLFHALIVSGVPKFEAAMDDMARRFVNLVDELYDRRVKLIVSADAEISELYQGERLAFEFERTASRLLEMQSHDYLSCGHLA